MKICIDARIRSGEFGGVEQVIIGLAHGFAGFTEGDDEYHFLVYKGFQDWLTPYLDGAPNLHLIEIKPPMTFGFKRRLLSIFPALRQLRDVIYNFWAWLRGEKAFIPDRSDGSIEAQKMDLMHFTSQTAFLTVVPSIYHPHDLQHIHLPQFFPYWHRKARETIYRAHASRAARVAVASSWTKRDMIEHLDLKDSSVKVVPLSPAVDAYPKPGPDEIDSVREKFELPEDFAFYPAQTWEHKNHITLIRATAYLRDEYGLRVPLVFSGKTNEFFAKIKKEIEALKLSDQVQFVGFVSPIKLVALYRLCRCVVIPTRFEAASFPMWEAFELGAPVACSNITSLPAQAGDAALIFDPDDMRSMAEAVRTLWEDEGLRQLLAERGKSRVGQFTWDRTCRHFRALYRDILGQPLTAEDAKILNAEPLL